MLRSFKQLKDVLQHFAKLEKGVAVTSEKALLRQYLYLCTGEASKLEEGSVTTSEKALLSQYLYLCTSKASKQQEGESEQLLSTS